jgi:hypothetical protein
MGVINDIDPRRKYYKENTNRKLSLEKLEPYLCWAELIGEVILMKFGKGSKSEYDAVYLDTGKKKYRLKRKGGNPFYDASLHKLIGKTIKVQGNVTPYFFEINNKPKDLTK